MGLIGVGALFRARISYALLLVLSIGPDLVLAAQAESGSPVGSWEGQLRQPHGTGEDRYPIELTLDETGGKTFYPSLKCGGDLDLVGSANGQFVFSETITTGRFDPKTDQGCIDGFLTIRLLGSLVVVVWSGIHDGDPFFASGTLPARSAE